jgi:hypothetical protein
MPPIGAERRTRGVVLSEWLGGWRLYGVMVGVALVIGALSLLIPSTPSYDPWAWLVWGREIVHLKLQTTGGPTWKPLPVIFTTLFAPFAHTLQPALWLVVGRAGSVMAVAMTFKLCLRLARQLGDQLTAGASALQKLMSWGPGLLAGVIAAIGLVFAGGFITANALGYSEGFATAIMLVAIERHLDGHRRQAFAVAFFVALDRPEIWLFWGPYGLWLWWTDKGARKLVVGLFVLIPILWFGPEYWGSGHFLRGVDRAHTPRSNSPAFAKCPFCTEFGKHAWPTVPSRIKATAILGILAACFELWRVNRARPGGITLRGGFRLETPREKALAMIATSGVLGFGWWAVIGIMTQIGFSGNDRYLVIGAALVEVAGGVTWGWIAIEIGRAAPRLLAPIRNAGARVRAAVAPTSLAAVTVIAFLVPSWFGGLVHFSKTHRALVYQALLRKDVQAAISRAGGPQAVLGCGAVMTEGFQVPMVAYYLGVHTLTIEASPADALHPGPAPNVILQARAQRNANLLPFLSSWPTVPYKLVTTTRAFRVYEHCSG